MSECLIFKPAEYASLPRYRQQLKDITTIQTETIRRLIETDNLPPMEMAEVLEDIANKILDISEEIRACAQGHSEAG